MKTQSSKAKQSADFLIDSVRDPKRAFVSSSFQTHSIPLLHIVHQVFQADAPIIVLTDTGFLFPETKIFAREICGQLDLKLVVARSEHGYFSQKQTSGDFLYTRDPDLCCRLNKISPINSFLTSHEVWINGARKDQTTFRADLLPTERVNSKCIRIHPLLDWSSKEIFSYRRTHRLREHPLDSFGYRSIGCQPCTAKFDPNRTDREARWLGFEKEECGLINATIVRS